MYLKLPEEIALLDVLDGIGITAMPWAPPPHTINVNYFNFLFQGPQPALVINPNPPPNPIIVPQPAPNNHPGPRPLPAPNELVVKDDDWEEKNDEIPEGNSKADDNELLKYLAETKKPTIKNRANTSNVVKKVQSNGAAATSASSGSATSASSGSATSVSSASASSPAALVAQKVTPLKLVVSPSRFRNNYVVANKEQLPADSTSEPIPKTSQTDKKKKKKREREEKFATNKDGDHSSEPLRATLQKDKKKREHEEKLSTEKDGDHLLSSSSVEEPKAKSTNGSAEEKKSNKQRLNGHHIPIVNGFHVTMKGGKLGGISKTKILELKQRAKILAKNMSSWNKKTTTPTKKTPSPMKLQPKITRIPKLMRVESQPEEPAKLQLERYSVLNMDKMSPAVETAVSGLVEEVASASPSTPARRVNIFGPPHSFVRRNGKWRGEVREKPAMYVPLENAPDVLVLLNNLTAKVTKAVRQNGGYPEWDEQQHSNEEPRFAQREQYCGYVLPKMFGNAADPTDDKNLGLDRSKLAKKRRMAQALDAEIDQVSCIGGQMVNDTTIITKNALHLYLFGIDSPYGDTANLESDFRRAIVTPGTKWTKPKPYVQMVINGLEFRGTPHISVDLPFDVDVSDISEDGEVAPIGFDMNRGELMSQFEREMAASNDAQYGDSTGAVASTAPQDPAPTNFISLTSPFAACTSTTSPVTPNEISPDITASYQPNEYNAFIPPQYRPRFPTAPPQQQQRQKKDSDYSDYATRIW